MYKNTPLTIAERFVLKIMRNQIIRWTVLVVLFCIGLLHYSIQPPQFGGWKPIIVTPGQTVWGLCEQYCPTADPRDVRFAICDRNHLQADSLQPGVTIWVPTKAS